MSNNFLQIFKDERGHYSSNRFVGIMCSVSLCITLFVNVFSKGALKPSDILVDAIAMLAFGSLGIGAANKIFAKPINTQNESIETSEPSGSSPQ